MTATWFLAIGAYLTAVALVFRFAKARVWQGDEVVIPIERIPGFGPPLTLGQVARDFFSQLCPLILLAAVVLAWGGRVYVGGWSGWDVLVAAGLIAAWPFQEWFVHVYLLHIKPFKLLGRRYHPLIARTHQAHHRNPWDPRLGLTAAHILVLYLGLGPLVWRAMLPTPQALTGTALFFTLVLNYEWVHYLIHTSYKPHSRLYRRLWQHHRLHHFKSEHYWYGVTMLAADRVLKTQPAARETQASDTCLTLGDENNRDKLTRAA